ncbi:MAG: PaaI family thioesterase [Candidatus Dormibacteraeota bacterium]|nr:PaaI family thioesterase [Candidatus Dormibacteraeota bacterium]
MSDREYDESLDQSWLNDHSEYQRNFVHGLRNAGGLHLQYHLAGHRVITTWVASEEHAGFPGFVHGGLIAAVLDDVMGRCSVLHRRWVVTGRMETRFREVAPLSVALRVEGWTTRFTRRLMQAQSQMSLEDGTVVAEATGTYLPIPESLLGRMHQAWPGFAEYTDDPA